MWISPKKKSVASWNSIFQLLFLVESKFFQTVNLLCWQTKGNLDKIENKAVKEVLPYTFSPPIWIYNVIQSQETGNLFSRSISCEPNSSNLTCHLLPDGTEYLSYCWSVIEINSYHFQIKLPPFRLKAKVLLFFPI